MSWFTDARVKRLQRIQTRLLGKLREKNDALMVMERMRAAAQDRADRRQKLLEEQDAELQKLRRENAQLLAGQLPETMLRPQMAIYPPEPTR